MTKQKYNELDIVNTIVEVIKEVAICAITIVSESGSVDDINILEIEGDVHAFNDNYKYTDGEKDTILNAVNGLIKVNLRKKEL